MSDPGYPPGEIRVAALEALGPHADPRAREALLHAEILVSPAEMVWESSAGRVEGHGATLRVDAVTLGRLRAAPALTDALHAALAAAICARVGHSLSRLDLRWASDAGHAEQQGYRDRPPAPPQTLGEALASYLAIVGEPVAARIVERAAVSFRTGVVSVVVAAGVRDELRRSAPGLAGALTAAVRDLLGDSEFRVVVED